MTISCKYDLMQVPYNNGRYIIDRPVMTSVVSDMKIRSCKFDPKPDVTYDGRTLKCKLSLAKYNSGFKVDMHGDALDIPEVVDDTFSITIDKYVYDDTLSAEENVRNVISIFNDMIKPWLFSFIQTTPESAFLMNPLYVRDAIGGCCWDNKTYSADHVDDQQFIIRYTASNGYNTRRRGDYNGLNRHWHVQYSYGDWNMYTPDTRTVSIWTLQNGYITSITLSSSMISPKMQYPDPDRGNYVARMQSPIIMTPRLGACIINYVNYNVATTGLLNSTQVTEGYRFKYSKLWLPSSMYVTGVNHPLGIFVYQDASDYAMKCWYCKYDNESSSITNTNTVNTISINIAATRPDLVFSNEFYCMLIPIYHYIYPDDEDEYNYFVTVMFYGNTSTNAYERYEGLYIFCMETGDFYDARTGYNHYKFILDDDMVTVQSLKNIIFLFGLQQYEDASAIGQNVYQYTVTHDDSNTIHTFHNKRVDICPYKLYGNYYLVNDAAISNYWYVYDIDTNKIIKTTNVNVARNHVVTLDGMTGFRFVVNNTTDYIVNDNFFYPNDYHYDENVVNSIGLYRPFWMNCKYTVSDVGNAWRYYGQWSYDSNQIFSNTYKPFETFEPLTFDTTTAFSIINTDANKTRRSMYFAVDIDSNDKLVQYHTKRQLPEHPTYSSLNHVNIDHYFIDGTALDIVPYRCIKIYIQPFDNNDGLVTVEGEHIDVRLKRSAIDNTLQRFYITLLDENDNRIEQQQLRERYGIAFVDIDYL